MDSSNSNLGGSNWCYCCSNKDIERERHITNKSKGKQRYAAAPIIKGVMLLES